MDSARWKQISDFASAVAETEPSEREQLLASRPELREEVESLLGYLEADSGPLDRPVPLPGAAPGQDRRIGPYRILGELGRGGMGIVLLAERDEVGFGHRVALKLARACFQSEFFTRRFLDERRILAQLEHPQIARLLDGGVTDDGTPYLVMPYVEGVSIDSWRQKHHASPAECIALLLKVCSAVAYAHEHLIVHRDLKPGNILVNAAGEPVLLDFGTARLLDHAEPTGLTATALPMITPRYASPEQARGLAGSIRGDVYSLGVILYELLTGEWPYVADGTGTPAILRAVAESEPIRPSRRTQDPARRRVLSGDLDAILLKALNKNPERRYASVLEFAADLRRHLAQQPVEARSPTFSYRAGRYLVRNKWQALAAAVALASLTSATVYSFRQAQLADREREKAVQVAQFLENLLGASRTGGVSPLASGGRELKVVDVIESAAAKTGEEFRDSPDIEVGLRATIGSALMALGEAAKARPHVERAVELSERLYGDNHAVTTRALTARGRLRMANGDYAGAQADLERTLAWHAASSHPDLPFQHSLLAESYFRRADLAGARRHFAAALAAMRRQFGDRHITTATMINNLGAVEDDAGDAEGAQKHFAEAAAILRALPGPPGNLVYPLFGLQRGHFFRGDYQQAKAISLEAYRQATKTGGNRHPNTLAAAFQLALAMAHLGDDGSESLARETLSIARATLPAAHIEISRGLTTFGRILIIRGKHAEAAAALREAYTIARKVYPKQNWRPAESQVFLGAALASLGQTDQAAEVLRQGLAEMRASLPESHPRVAEARRIAERCLSAAPARCTQ